MDDPYGRVQAGHVAARVRELRLARCWTQRELADRLGLSQARLSEIERGKGSLTAEQLLEALALFNVSIGDFRPLPVGAPMQNALRQHGAPIPWIPGAPIPSRLSSLSGVVEGVLLEPLSPLLVTALGPVLLRHIDHLSLPLLHERLDSVGWGNRVGWLLENVRDALEAPPSGADRQWRAQAARAHLVINNALPAFEVRSWPSPDPFDRPFRSRRMASLVLQRRASPVSRRWEIASRIQVDQFREMLWATSRAKPSLPGRGDTL